MEHVVVFDLAPTARGPYYVTGEHVRHRGLVCLVTRTSRIEGTRYRAHLQVVHHPTQDQRNTADAWLRRTSS